MRPRVILASSSPRRRDLLTLIGVPHEVKPANIDESYRAGETPTEHAERLARSKALAVAAADAVTIGSDTIVVLDGRVLGKPKTASDAEGMLAALSGREHTVITAVAVHWQDRTLSAVEQVRVVFRDLTATDIQQYVRTGEPMDKAGSYGIQGYGATIVERVTGDYFAVMGLPLNRLVALLRDHGLHYDFGPITVEA